jgi:outer membrane immunogenic protein
LLSTVALVGLTAGAVAADLPVRAAPPPIPVPIFTWSGFYVGVNAGWGWQDNNNDVFTDSGIFAVPVLGGGVATYTLADPVPFFGSSSNNDAFVGGAQIGYNFQPNPGGGFVWGIEADIQGVASDNNDNNNAFFAQGSSFLTVPATAAAVTAPGFGVAPTVPGAAGNIALFENAFRRGTFGNGGLDWFGTLRARAGFAIDRVLIYATGGLAFASGGDNNNNVIFAANSAPLGFFVSPAAALVGTAVTPANFGGFANNDDVNWGWTLGGGVEWAFTNNLTFKLEGLYVNIDRDNNNNNVFVGTGVGGVSNTGAPVTRTDIGFFPNNNDSNDFFVVRGGLNYKFNTF